MSAWAKLVNADGSDEWLELCNRALVEVQGETAQRLSRAQKAFFGDVSSQGNDGNWYGMSDWLTEVLNSDG